MLLTLILMSTPALRAVTHYSCSKLVAVGVGHLLLNIGCGVVCFGIGVESNLDTALAVAVLCSLALDFVSLGEDLNGILCDEQLVPCWGLLF